MGWVEQGRFFSPALLAQQTLHQLAGTSMQDYRAFQQSVDQFSQVWRDYFEPKVFQDVLMSYEELSQVPEYQPIPYQSAASMAVNVVSLAGYCLILGGPIFL